MNGSRICESSPTGFHDPSRGPDVVYGATGARFTAEEHRDSKRHGSRYVAVRTCEHCDNPIYTANLSYPDGLEWECWVRPNGWCLFDKHEMFQYIIMEEEELSWL